MRRVVVQQWTSLDGRAADASGSEDALFTAVPDDSASEAHNLELLRGVDEVLLGRRTYEQFASYWPTELAAGEAMAALVNALPKTVASASLATSAATTPWGEHAPARVVADAVEHVRSRGRSSGTGTTVVWGSLALTRSLLRAGLVDELDLFVAPVLLGGGTALLGDDGSPVRLELLESEAWPGGLLHLRYACLTDGSAGGSADESPRPGGSSPA